MPDEEYIYIEQNDAVQADVDLYDQTQAKGGDISGDIVVTGNIEGNIDVSNVHGLAPVATSGDYTDLTGAPTEFEGATASADGTSGLVPAPEAGDQDKVLKGDGTWGAIAASDIPNIDASKITSGTIDIARLPAGALERLVTVADQTARFALTASDVQLGDTVKQLDTGLMYIVTDTASLSSEAGYTEYTAGSATSVPWSGVTGKPSSYTPSSHAHGNLTNDGKIGSTANLPLITTTSGKVTTGSFGTAANTFCQGNDSRLSNARTPTSHTHGSITNDGKLGTASCVVVTDASKNVAVSAVTSTELGYLDGVTSNVQTQLNAKADDSDVVHKTGNEGISGTKTFNSQIVGTIGTSVGNGGYADMIQTYQSDNGANRSCTIRCTNGDGFNEIFIGAHNESNGAPNGLAIKNTAGTVTGEFAGSLRLTRTTDASGTLDNGPALSIGSTSGTHLELDGNEIMAKASGTTTGPFYINAQGGDVYIGGNTDSYKSVTGRGKGSSTVPVYTDANGIVTACGSSLDVDVSGNALTATKLATPRTINGVSFDGSANITVEDSTKVSKSGDKMTGNLTVKKSVPQIILRDPSLVRGTAPESNYTGLEILGRDYNNRSTWALYHTYATNKTHRIRLLCYNGLTTDNQYAEIGVGYDSSGNAYTNAPTPAAGDNSTKIATTAFVKTKCDDYLPLTGGTLTGALNERSSNVNISVEPSSLKEYWGFLITKNLADTTHTGNLMRLGVSQAANTKDYRIMLGVSNPRAGNLPTQESIAGGTDDADASISNCWGSIGIYYDYSKNRAYPYCWGLSTCDLSDSSSERLATNRWVRTATGNFACNAATATAFSASKSVTLTGAVTGTASSTGGWSIATKWRSCMLGRTDSGISNPWYKVASRNLNGGSSAYNITFYVENANTADKSFGILRVSLGTNSDRTINAGVTKFAWLVNDGFAEEDFVLVCPATAEPTVELWAKFALGYLRRRFVVISEGGNANTGILWTLFDAASAGQEASIPTQGTQVVSTDRAITTVQIDALFS